MDPPSGSPAALSGWPDSAGPSGLQVAQRVCWRNNVPVGAAIVTGGASGIGWALGRQLARKDHYVHLVDLHPAEEFARELGGAATTR